MNVQAALSAFFGVSIFIFFFGLDRWFEGQASTIEMRLERYATRAKPASSEEGVEFGKFKPTRLNRLLAAGAGAQLQTELARADLPLTASEYVLINFGSMLIGILIGLVVFKGNLLLIFLGAIAGFYLPRWYLRYLQRKRLGTFNGQLGDTIVLLANSLRSGYSLLQSLETASKELPKPISEEFTRVTREIGLGLTIQEALANLLRRIPSDDLDLMITAINVQHEVGGNLAEILDTIAFTIRERVRIVGEIHSITSQQRLSGTILSILPVVLGLIMYVLNPGYISNMWGNMCGWLMMGVGGILIVLGYFVIRKIASIEV